MKIPYFPPKTYSVTPYALPPLRGRRIRNSVFEILRPRLRRKVPKVPTSLSATRPQGFKPRRGDGVGWGLCNHDMGDSKTVIALHDMGSPWTKAGPGQFYQVLTIL